MAPGIHDDQEPAIKGYSQKAKAPKLARPAWELKEVAIDCLDMPTYLRRRRAITNPAPAARPINAKVDGSGIETA